MPLPFFLLSPDGNGLTADVSVNVYGYAELCLKSKKYGEVIHK